MTQTSVQFNMSFADLWHGNKVTEKLVYRCHACAMTYTLTALRLGLPGVPTAEATDDALVDRRDDELPRIDV